MVWDPDRYEAWFDTPEGQYALDREVQLLQDVLAGWPRRKHKLLEIGCGTGLFLDHLYQMGLDVTGIDNSPEMIMAARKRFGNRAELHLAHGEHMGFSDNEFDYALLWSVLEFSDEPEAMLAEAARVAEKGVLIGFLNKNSLYYSLNVRKSGSTLAKAHWFTWCEMQDLVHRATGFRPTLARSVLAGPMSTWKDTRACNLINARILPPALGAFVAARVDFTNMKPLTPLFAWKSEPEMG
ncbi:MAG: class I SAM-dependent methyltransferase [Pseudodesulfovibrio sp.]|jgi:SAM-dependent methyltransferase|uniref:Methyltransferase family protein n=1 Tax=Pseudodesulfovibrio indicus TaxID=1716143 RepID=A0A126QJ25_9BACT|nr:class I SAM-dependent methyltransferase [Pseudodesulfovibrio indicus]AMK09980.1 methyltransferase type 11 [Pseudodesulfovibrio indicus]TDT87055.1 methyltransferase family protein [Pseudodesulfovibrio indicus]